MQRACRYCLDFYNPNLNKKMSAKGGKKHISRQLSSLTERRGQNFRSTSHVSADSWGKICPFTNSRVHWQDCRHQIPQPHMSGFKTSSKSFKPFLSPTLENTELTYSVSVSGSSSNSPMRPPDSMAPLLSPTLYLKTSLILLCANLEVGGDLKRRKNSHVHWNAITRSFHTTLKLSLFFCALISHLISATIFSSSVKIYLHNLKASFNLGTNVRLRFL